MQNEEVRKTRESRVFHHMKKYLSDPQTFSTFGCLELLATGWGSPIHLGGWV